MRRVYHPKQATFPELTKAILNWEAELDMYLTASQDAMSEKNRVICLEDICPEPLQQHLVDKADKLQHTDGTPSYIKYKAEINEYLYTKTRFNKAGKLNLVGGVGDTGDDDNSTSYEGIPDDEDWESPLLAEIMALVRGNIQKKGKGKGRNKGKGDDATKAGKSTDVEMGASAGAEDKR